MMTNLYQGSVAAALYSFLHNRPKSIGATCDEIQEALGLSKFDVLRVMGQMANSDTIRKIIGKDNRVYTRFTRRGGLAICWTLTNHRY